MQLGKTGLGIQVAEQGTDLFDRRIPPQLVSYLVEIEQINQERLVDASFTDVPNNEVKFPHLPALQFSPQPQKAVNPVEVRSVQSVDGFLVGIAGGVFLGMFDVLVAHRVVNGNNTILIDEFQ